MQNLWRRKMKSKYSGSTCVECNNKIERGMEITKRNGKWVHEDCKAVQLSDAPNPFSKKQAVNIPVPISDAPTQFNIDWEPSVYQKALFEEIVNGKGNIVVKATAGSGKTTSMMRSIEYLPLMATVKEQLSYDKFDETLKTIDVDKAMRVLDIAFLAFNKAIATEVQNKLLAKNITYVQASTIHSFGYKVCKKNGKVNVDSYKLDNIMDKYYPADKNVEKAERMLNRYKRSFLKRLVSLVKATLTDANNTKELEEIIDYYGIGDSFEYVSEILTVLPKVIQDCLDDTENIDYDDMIWLPDDFINNEEFVKI